MAHNNFSVESSNHTGFTVASLEAALQFWHGVLGLPILGRRQLDLGAEPNTVGVANAKMEQAMLALPGGHNVELLEYTSPDGRDAVKPRPCDVGHIHFAINVKNCIELITEAKKIGWTPASKEPIRITRPDGQVWQICYLRSPEGLTVELMERLES